MSNATPTDNTNQATAEPYASSRYIYRYHADSLATLSILLLGIILLGGLLAFYIFVQFNTEPKPLHFQLDENQQIIAPVPLDEPGITNAALLNWVNSLVMDAFNFNYSNMNRQQNRLTYYFSDAAMKNYTDLLTNDEDFMSVVANKNVVSITPKAAPEIIVAQTYQGRYVWQIEVPARIVFSNALSKSIQDVVFDFLVWRVSATEAPLGIITATFTRKVNSRMAPQGIMMGF